MSQKTIKYSIIHFYLKITTVTCANQLVLLILYSTTPLHSILQLKKKKHRIYFHMFVCASVLRPGGVMLKAVSLLAALLLDRLSPLGG